MTRRHELQRRIRTLGEVNEIMESMRMLSLLEARKLAKFIDCQRAVVETIRTTAADFLSSYPPVRPAGGTVRAVLLAVGSERGFCGDFNVAIRDRLAELSSGRETTVVAVGRKLVADLEHLGDHLHPLDGPTTADEVPALLQNLVVLLEAWATESGGLSLTAVHHGGLVGKLIETAILPAFADLRAPDRSGANPLRLYLSPEAFFSALVEQYLFAQLHEIAFTSLLCEHQRRVQHLEGATQRLGDTLDALRRRQATLRQEEITEELEVILLGADLVGPGSR